MSSTDSTWATTSNGKVYTAQDIEKMSTTERQNLDAVKNYEILFYQEENKDTGETWTAIKQYDYPHKLLATINYEIPLSATMNGEHIEFLTPSKNSKFGIDGCKIEVHDYHNVNDENQEPFQIVSFNDDGLLLEQGVLQPTN